MPTLNDDLSYLEFSVAALEDYLLSGDIFWPLSGGQTGHLPRMSLGGILLAMARSAASVQSPAQQSRLRRVKTAIEAARSRWQTTWARKAGREFEARLRQWAAFLHEYRENPSGQAAYYAYEVRLRVMLDLLLREGGENITPAAQEMYQGLDAILRAVFESGDFLWDASLKAGFPQNQYWYLHGSVRSA
ncbi:MAG: hypothetical protein Fur0018_04130 [Anaerolineales bacterium]